MDTKQHAPRGKEFFQLRCADMPAWLAANASEPVLFDWSKCLNGCRLPADVIKAMREHARLHGQPWDWDGAFRQADPGSLLVANWAAGEGHKFRASRIMTDYPLKSGADLLGLARVLFRLPIKGEGSIHGLYMTEALSRVIQRAFGARDGTPLDPADAPEICALFVEYALSRKPAYFITWVAMDVLDDYGLETSSDDARYAHYLRTKAVLRSHARSLVDKGLEHSLMPCADVWSVVWAFAV